MAWESNESSRDVWKIEKLENRKLSLIAIDWCSKSKNEYIHVLIYRYNIDLGTIEEQDIEQPEVEVFKWINEL